MQEEDSNYAILDVLLSGGELNDDGTSTRYPKFNVNVDMENQEFKIGIFFVL